MKCIGCQKDNLDLNSAGYCDTCENQLNNGLNETLESNEAPVEPIEDEADDNSEQAHSNSQKDSDNPKTSKDTTSQDSLKQQALGGAAKAVVGGENVEKVTAAAELAKRTAAKVKLNAERASWAIKGLVATLTNPVFWISLLVIVALFIVSNFAVTTYQTVGSQKAEGAGATVASDMLQRLAQRATLLQLEAYKYSNSDAFVAAFGGAPKTNGNPWAVACPDIVNIIYGLPDNYIGNMGFNNAERNYDRLLAAGLTPTAWWFPGSSSPGATQGGPTAGAIVSTTPNHTYVILTDDQKIIDNTWTIHAGSAGSGFRTLNESEKNRITGWYVPPSEGYEGTFLDDDPMLPAVPEWAKIAGASSTTAVSSTAIGGSPQQIAQPMVTAKGWSNADYTCLVSLWQRESNWRTTANNPSSGAYGIPQALPGSKMASAGSDWQTNPATQIKWGLDYIQDRYDTPCGAWAHSEANNWY